MIVPLKEIINNVMLTAKNNIVEKQQGTEKQKNYDLMVIFQFMDEVLSVIDEELKIKMKNYINLK